MCGGGGVIQARISAIQILYEILVRNLFGVFKDLCPLSDLLPTFTKPEIGMRKIHKIFLRYAPPETLGWDGNGAGLQA